MDPAQDRTAEPFATRLCRGLWALLLLLAATALPAQAPKYVEYRSGWDTQNQFFKMVLYIEIVPANGAVLIDGGRIEFKDLDQPYQIRQAAGKLVPKPARNQMTGDVFFSQANIGITSTLFTGQLNGNLGGSSSTLTANNVRFSHRGRTYHWNNGQGAPVGGTVALRDAAGRTYGPWAVSVSAASNNVKANWTANANVTLPAGSYTIQNSNPSTWARNAQSAGRGFAKVWGQ